MSVGMINPYWLLGVGGFFALIYAALITIGWALTRRARRIIVQSAGVKPLPGFWLDQWKPADALTSKYVSLTANRFVDNDGAPIDMSLYEPYIALSESARYPQILIGDLLLFEKDSLILKHAFHVPSLTHYR